MQTGSQGRRRERALRALILQCCETEDLGLYIDILTQPYLSCRSFVDCICRHFSTLERPVAIWYDWEGAGEGTSTPMALKAFIVLLMTVAVSSAGPTSEKIGLAGTFGGATPTHIHVQEFNDIHIIQLAYSF